MQRKKNFYSRSHPSFKMPFGDSKKRTWSEDNIKL